MTAIFGHHPWTVQELVTGVSSGQVRLPDLQRPFVWSNAKVRDLIDSMYRGYPVGELMFWANRDEAHEKVIGVFEHPQVAAMRGGLVRFGDARLAAQKPMRRRIQATHAGSATFA